jgi:type I restriction enzyme S subunit
MLDLPIPIPPHREQVRIVAEVEKLLSRLQAAVDYINQAQIKIDRYRVSVLNTAREGRLAKTNLHDEPAATLLERIRQIKADQGQVRRGRHKPVTASRSLARRDDAI